MKKKFKDMLVSDDLIETVIRQAFYLGFCSTREGYNAECPYDELAPAHLFIEDNPSEYAVENIPRKNQDWEDFSSGEAFKSLQDEAVRAIISRLGRKEG